MIFAESGYLFLLLLIPLFIIVQTLVLRFRRRRLEKFGDEALVKNLMPSYSKAKVWLRLSFFLLAFFFFVLGISRPQMGAILKEVAESTGGRYFRATDNTKLAEIYSEINKMEKAKTTVDSFPVYKELFGSFAVWALFALLLELFLNWFVIRRLP